MGRSMLDPAEKEGDLARLDEMNSQIEPYDAKLLKEHLKAARQYLFGAMPKEYLLNLEGARGALDEVTDSDVRDRLKTTIGDLIDNMPAAAPKS